MLNNIEPKAIYTALHKEVEGVELDVIAKSLGMYRKRRRWWFDESDGALRRRCTIAFVEKYDVLKLAVLP